MLTISTKLRIDDTINAIVKTERRLIKTLTFRNRSVLFLHVAFLSSGQEN